MMARNVLIATLLGCMLYLGCATTTRVVFVDSADGSYIREGQSIHYTPSLFVSTVSAVSGLVPHAVDATSAQTINEVLLPSPFKKPRAVVLANIAGTETDNLLPPTFSTRKTRVGTLSAHTNGPVPTALQTAASLVQSNPDVNIEILDQKSLPGCLNDCIESHLVELTGIVGGKYTAGTEPLRGTLAFDGCTLDLSNLNDRLFAMELAGLYGGASAQLRALQARKDQAQAQEDVELYEVALVGGSALAHHYGSGSCQAAAAQQVTASLMAWLVNSFDSVYGGDVVFAVSVMGEDAAVHGAPMQELMVMKDTARRSLLQTSTDSAARVEQSKKFSVKAAGYGAFILLLYFILAGVYCMCNMPFKQDTLLYTRAKVD